MNKKNGMMMLALWALLLAPILCGVGLLAHYCVCDDSSACSHELSCTTDPCQVIAVGQRSDDLHHDTLAAAAVTSALVAMAVPQVDNLTDPGFDPVPSAGPVPLHSVLVDGVLPLLC